MATVVSDVILVGIVLFTVISLKSLADMAEGAVIIYFREQGSVRPAVVCVVVLTSESEGGGLKMRVTGANGYC